jgi:hypothetical protein
MQPERGEGSVAAQRLHCEECGREWLQAAEHWLMLLTDDDPPQAVTYCPECADREFGENRWY